MSFDNWSSTYKVFVFYFHHPCLFYPYYNLSLQALFCFHFPHFYFAYNFVVLQKGAPSQLFSGAIPWRGTSRELSLEVVVLKDTNLLSGSVSTSVITSRPRWSSKSIPFVWISPGEKKMEPNQLFLVWCIWSWLIWVSVKILMTFFGFCKTQVPDLASRDLWWQQHGHISCCNSWKIREKSSLIQFHVLPCN